MQLTMDELKQLVDGNRIEPEPEPVPVPVPKPAEPTRQIVVLDRGWVFIGMVTESPTHITITNASCIRRWGTIKGIGQLALEGPRPETILEPSGTVRASRTAVICVLDCEEKSWKKH